MSQTVQLYDLRAGDHPNNRGSEFRSFQVFECLICGGLSNKVILGGYPGHGVRVACPNSAECWHHELERMVNWLKHPHPQTYKDELQKEVNEMEASNRHRVEDDIVGSPDMAQKREVTNTFSRIIGSPCTHDL